MAYSSIFRSIDIFSQFQTRYSGITQEQFLHILNLIQADSGIFRTLVYLGTQCFTHIQAYSRSFILDYTYRGIFAYIRAYFSRFRHIKDPCTTGPSSVNQHLLFKSGSFFKSFSKSIWNIFSFCVKNRHLRFCSSGQHFDNNNNNNNNILPTLARHSRHPHQHAVNTKTPPILPSYPSSTRQHVTHASNANHTRMLSAQERHPRQYTTLATTPPTQARYPHHPSQHEQYAISKTGLKVFYSKKLPLSKF